jgi:hypothetical protein
MERREKVENAKKMIINKKKEGGRARRTHQFGQARKALRKLIHRVMLYGEAPISGSLFRSFARQHALSLLFFFSFFLSFFLYLFFPSRECSASVVALLPPLHADPMRLFWYRSIYGALSPPRHLTGTH